MARVAPTTRPKKPQKPSLWFLSGLWFFAELVVFAVFVVFCRLCGFLPSLWFLGEFVVFVGFVVFGRACGSPFQSRDKGQTAKEFDATVEVVLVTRIGGCYEYD